MVKSSEKIELKPKDAKTGRAVQVIDFIKKEKRISYVRIATMLGTYDSTITKMKNGTMSVQDDIVTKMSELWGVSEDYIYGKSKQMFISNEPRSVLENHCEYICDFIRKLETQLPKGFSFKPGVRYDTALNIKEIFLEVSVGQRADQS